MPPLHWEEGLIGRLVTPKPLLPRCWDPEDFKDTWKKQNALPWQSHKVGRPTRNGDGGAVTWGPRAGTAVSSTPRHAFTCSWGTIKVWSPVCQVVEDRFPERCLPVQVRAGLVGTGGAPAGEEACESAHPRPGGSTFTPACCPQTAGPPCQAAMAWLA